MTTLVNLQTGKDNHVGSLEEAREAIAAGTHRVHLDDPDAYRLAPELAGGQPAPVIDSDDPSQRPMDFTPPKPYQSPGGDPRDLVRG